MSHEELLDAELEHAYVQGRDAGLEGADRGCNPYLDTVWIELACAWDEGWETITEAAGP